MAQNSDIIRGLYDAFAKGDIPAVLATLASDISWTEAEGGPYGGVSIGPRSGIAECFYETGWRMGRLLRYSPGIHYRGQYRCRVGRLQREFQGYRKELQRTVCPCLEIAGWQGRFIPAIHRHGIAFKTNAIKLIREDLVEVIWRPDGQVMVRYKIKLTQR